jgi:hypothetical protein
MGYGSRMSHSSILMLYLLLIEEKKKKETKGRNSQGAFFPRTNIPY